MANKQITPAQKAFSVLKKNLNYYDLQELAGLIEEHLEKESQNYMAESFGITSPTKEN